jgi:hypothetical protein
MTFTKIFFALYGIGSTCFNKTITELQQLCVYGIVINSKGSCLKGCNAVLLGEWFPVFLEDCNAFIFKGQPLPSVTA